MAKYITIKIKNFPTPMPDMAENLRSRILAEAGPIYVKWIQMLLGQSALYRLSPDYKYRKLSGLTRPRMIRKAGKDIEQPLILTGAHIYDTITCNTDTGELVVGIPDSEGFSDEGFDIAGYWEDKTRYIELGIEAAEPDIEKLVDRILKEELNKMFA